MGKYCVIMQRIKNNYENRNKNFLTRRTPVIIRIDGKAFHTYTQNLNKPFDKGLIDDMNNTAIYLCENIQGAKCAYVQSDEISILVTDFDTVNTQAWFNYNQSKIESVSTSLATAKSNQLRLSRYLSEIWETDADNEDILNLFSENINKINLAHFDSRSFNIPKEEVSNYFLARQNDCVKNSISTVAQNLYSHKELEGKNSNKKQKLIFQKGLNWNDFHFGEKRGRFIIKNTYFNNLSPDDYYLQQKHEPSEEECIKRTKWEITETPLNFSENDFKHFLINE